MRYTFFEFQNFKGIKHARLDLEKRASTARVYTLVGLNESGKTTVLEAIDRFQPSGEGISPRQLGDWEPVDPHLLIPIADRTNFKGQIVVEVGVELDEDDVDAARRHLRAAADGYRLEDLERTVTITDQYEYKDSQFIKRRSTWTGLKGEGRTKQGKKLRPLAYSSDQERWQVLATFIRERLPTIWYFPNFLFDFPEKIYLEPSDEEEEANRFYRHLFQDILDALNKDLTIETHVLERWRSEKRSDRENLKQTLLEAGRHVTQTVVSSWTDIFADKPIDDKRIEIEIGQDEEESTAGEGATATTPQDAASPGRVCVGAG